MSTKKEKRYCSLGASAEMVLQLDPDIYDPDTCTILGLTKIAGNGAKTVPVNLRQAARSDGATLLQVTVERGEGDLQERRVVPLLCETSKVSSAKTGLIDKTLKLGGTVTSNWKIVSVK